MSIVLVGSSSGSVTLQEPAVAGTTVLTLPATSGTLLQSGTAVTAAQGGTGLTSVGTSGNVLTSNGTAWTSVAPAAPTTAQVLAATAGASLGEVGVYSWLWTTTTGALTAGSTIAGSDVRYAGFQTGSSGTSNNSDNSLSGNGGTPSGTWRVMGRGAQANYSVFLGLRIS